MADSRQKKTRIYVLFGTTQKEKKAPLRTALPYLVATEAKVDIRKMFPGPGTTKAGKGLNNLCILSTVINWVFTQLDKLSGYSMPNNIVDAWLNISDVGQEDDVILIGCSRGGFSAQILAQVVSHYGYIEGDSHLRGIDIRKGIVKGTPRNGKIKALYALDPVGTMGFPPLTPPKLLGFCSKRWSGAISRARVILMFDERNPCYKPNIEQMNNERLEQIWFSGKHSDAWGPSFLSLNVLAYVIKDLKKCGITVNEDAVLNAVKQWPPAAFCDPCDPEPSTRLFRFRRRLRNDGEFGQRAHWTLQGEPETPEKELRDKFRNVRAA